MASAASAPRDSASRAVTTAEPASAASLVTGVGPKLAGVDESVEAVALAVAPGAARRAVAVLDVAEAPADLGDRVGGPVGAGRGHLGAGEGLRDAVGRGAAGCRRARSSWTRGSTASRGSRTGPGSSRTRRAAPRRSRAGPRRRGPRCGSSRCSLPSESVSFLSGSAAARLSERVTTGARSVVASAGSAGLVGLGLARPAAAADGGPGDRQRRRSRFVAAPGRGPLVGAERERGAADGEPGGHHGHRRQRQRRLQGGPRVGSGGRGTVLRCLVAGRRHEWEPSLPGDEVALGISGQPARGARWLQTERRHRWTFG